MEENSFSLSEDCFSETDTESLPWGEKLYLPPVPVGLPVQFEHHTLQRAFQRVFTTLTQNIVVDDYLDHLLEKEVINFGVMDVIRSRSGGQDMARELLGRVCKRDKGCEVMMELFQHPHISQCHLYDTVLKEYKSLEEQSRVTTEKLGYCSKGTSQTDASYGKYAEFVIEIIQSQTIEGGTGNISSTSNLAKYTLSHKDKLSQRIVQELNCLIIDDSPSEEEYVRLIALTLAPVSSLTAESDFEWVELSNLMTELATDDQWGMGLHCYVRKIHFCPFTSADQKANVVDSLAIEERQSVIRQPAGMKNKVSSNTETIPSWPNLSRGLHPGFLTRHNDRTFTSLCIEGSEYKDSSTSPLLETEKPAISEECATGMEGQLQGLHLMESARSDLSNQKSMLWSALKEHVSGEDQSRRKGCQHENPYSDALPRLPSQRGQLESPGADTPTSLPSQRWESEVSAADALPSVPSLRPQGNSPNGDGTLSLPPQRQQSETPDSLKAPKDLLALLRKVSVGVGKEKVKSSKVMNDVTTRIVGVLQSEHELVLHPSYAGSSFEGAKIEAADEYDVLIILNGKELDSTRQHPQFASLHPRNPDNHKFKEYLDSDGFLDPAKISSQIYSWTQLAANKLFPIGHEYQVTMRKNGPAVTLSIKCKEKSDFDKIDVDLVPAFEVLNDIYVPKPCKADIEISAVNDRMPKKEVLWRKSFSLLEKQRLKLIDKGGGCRRQCLRLLKFLRLRESTLKGLDSYHYKILLLNECERLPQTPDTWAADQLAERFWGLLNQLAVYLEQRKLPHCCDRDINVFEDIKYSAMENMRTRLRSIIKKGVPEMEKILNRDPLP